VERDLVRWPIEPLERGRRGIDERISLAAPWLRHRITAAIERAPAGSPMRKAALTRSVRSGYAAINRDDYEAIRAALHPDVELYPPGKGRGGIGFDPVYRGPDGVTRFVKQWKSGFSRFRYEPREIVDPGGSSFAVRIGMIGTMHGSDTEVRDEYGTVVDLKDGRVIRQENFYEWSAALETLVGRQPSERDTG
jgi:ketosteroid isomerase-like protein